MKNAMNTEKNDLEDEKKKNSRKEMRTIEMEKEIRKHPRVGQRKFRNKTKKISERRKEVLKQSENTKEEDRTNIMK